MTPPPAKVKRVLETRIGEWQVVSKPTEDEKPKEDPPEAEDAFDEDDLSTFRLTQKTYPSNTIDLADEEEKNEPFVEPTSLFRKRKAANKAIRKK
ncbi:hypothetical protein L0F63_006320 [Massospora cicadina]|nr:hypothetical protein L0F63_006320 [Massospora cicadina]